MTNPECRRCTVCVEGESFETAACTATSDTMCEPCTAEQDCGQNQFLSKSCTSSSDAICSPCTQEADCDPDQFLSGVCGGTTDASCQSCHPSCLRCNGDTSRSCTACKIPLLLSHFGFSNAGTCVNVCPAGEAANVDTSVCEPCHTSCSNCTAPTNSTSCTSCTGDHSLTSRGECTPVCPDETYGSLTSYECKTCTTCSQTTFESTPCTHSTNRVCTMLSVCPPGTHITTPHTKTSDRHCGDCGKGTFQSNYNQASCISWSACNSETQYQTTSPTTSSDRFCSPYTTCQAGLEYQSTAPTQTTDRICSVLTTCKVRPCLCSTVTCKHTRVSFLLVFFIIWEYMWPYFVSVVLKI